MAALTSLRLRPAVPYPSVSRLRRHKGLPVVGAARLLRGALQAIGCFPDQRPRVAPLAPPDLAHAGGYRAARSPRPRAAAWRHPTRWWTWRPPRPHRWPGRPASRWTTRKWAGAERGEVGQHGEVPLSNSRRRRVSAASMVRAGVMATPYTSRARSAVRKPCATSSRTSSGSRSHGGP